MSAVASFINSNDVTLSSLLIKYGNEGYRLETYKKKKKSKTRYKRYGPKLILRAKHVRQVAVHHLKTTMTTTPNPLGKRKSQIHYVIQVKNVGGVVHHKSGPNGITKIVTNGIAKILKEGLHHKAVNHVSVANGMPSVESGWLRHHRGWNGNL